MNTGLGCISHRGVCANDNQRRIIAIKALFSDRSSCRQCGDNTSKAITADSIYTCFCFFAVSIYIFSSTLFLIFRLFSFSRACGYSPGRRYFDVCVSSDPFLPAPPSRPPLFFQTLQQSFRQQKPPFPLEEVRSLPVSLTF